MLFREHKIPDGGSWEMDHTNTQRWVENHKTVHQYSIDGVAWYTIGEAIPGFMRGLPLEQPEFVEQDEADAFMALMTRDQTRRVTGPSGA